MVVLPGSAGQSTLRGGHVCTRAMAKIAALRLSTAASPSPTPGGGEARTVVGHSGSPRSPLGAVVCRSDTNDGGPALDRPSVLGGAVSGNRCNRGITHSGPTSPGLAPERDRLRNGGLSDNVIQIIQAARVGSTTACYRTKWLGFQRWCEEGSLETLSGTLGSILSYLHALCLSTAASHSPLLEGLRREQLSVILVAPGRRSAPWYTEVTQMMVGQPWTVPQFRGRCLRKRVQ